MTEKQLASIRYEKSYATVTLCICETVQW